VRSILTIIALALLIISKGQKAPNRTDKTGSRQGFWTICKDTSAESGMYINNKREGQWIFYENSRLVKILSYINDNLDGYSISFNYDGSVYRNFCYKNGMLNGRAIFYSKQGYLRAIYMFSNDGIDKIDYYDAEDKDVPPRFHGYVPSLTVDSLTRRLPY